MVQSLINRIFVKKTNNLLVQLIRYTVVGGLAFIVDYGLLITLTEFCGLNYIVSATISFISGLCVNYLISIRWVFTKSVIKDKKSEFLAYATIGIVGLGLNDLLMFVLTELLSVAYYISKLLAAVLVYAWNFLGRRFLIFNVKQKRLSLKNKSLSADKY